MLWAIVAVVVGLELVFLYALMNAAKRADEWMGEGDMAMPADGKDSDVPQAGKPEPREA